MKDDGSNAYIRESTPVPEVRLKEELVKKKGLME
jgi:hypothetical protein